jgi:transcriptional/translational regulatory protein YebC/TACO1
VEARLHRKGRGSAGATPEHFELEGYGPGGSVFLVSCASSDVPGLRARLRRVLFAHGAQPGAQGSVAYLFNRVGVLAYAAGTPARSLQAAAYHAGAEEVVAYSDDSIEVLSDPAELTHIQAALAVHGHFPMRSDIARRCAGAVTLRGPAAQALLALTDALAAEEGVLEVGTNAVLGEAGSGG